MIGKPRAKIDVVFDQFVGRFFRAVGFFENVKLLLAIEELRSSNIERDENLIAEFVTGFLHRARNRFERVVRRFQLRRESTFIADVGGETAIFQTRSSARERPPRRNASASANVGAPFGMIMNSWKSIGASECAPAFRMFIIGTGKTFASGPPR